MRVLMLTHNMVGLSSYLRAHSIAKWLVHAGHRVTLIAGRRRPGLRPIEEQVEGVTVLQMPDVFRERMRHGGLSPLDLLGRMLHVRQTRYDIVHGFEPRPCVTVPALLARRWWRTPYVADSADLWGMEGIAGLRSRLGRATLGRFDDSWEKFTRGRADGVIAISTNLAARARALGLPPDRIQWVPVGANPDVIVPMSAPDMRRKHGLPADAQIVVHTGFAPYDARLLAETFVVLARRNPRALLVMTGGQLPQVSESLCAAGLADRVRHFGFVPYDALGEVLACGDVMVVPYTNREVNIARYPNRIGDYLAAGRPIATNLTGDLGRLVPEEGIGVAVSDSAPTFADAIQALLDDPPLREAMGQRARRLAETRLSWRAMADRVGAFYRTLANGRAALPD